MKWLQKLPDLSLKMRLALALICGGMATLTLPPVFWFILIIPAYSGLFLLLNTAQKPKHAFWIGWFFGLSYYVSGLYWFVCTAHRCR